MAGCRTGRTGEDVARAGRREGQCGSESGGYLAMKSVAPSLGTCTLIASGRTAVSAWTWD